MDSFSDIARALRAARALLGIRQDDLANLANISRQMVARIEKESRGVPIDAIEKVRGALEREGVDFFPATASHGPSVALRKRGNP